MKHTQHITIVVNGKTIQAAIQLDALAWKPKTA